MDTAYTLGNPSAPVVRESIEWCKIWVPDSADSRLEIPRILLIGDSITVAYGPHLAEILDGEASVSWIGTSRFPTDPAFLDEILLVLRHTRFDLVQFNNGLHGFRNADESFATILPELLVQLRVASLGARWLLAASTPKRLGGQLHLWNPRTERIRLRNEVLAEIARAERLAYIDLFTLMEPHPEMYDPDGVHFLEAGQILQAHYVADTLRREIAEWRQPD